MRGDRYAGPAGLVSVGSHPGPRSRSLLAWLPDIVHPEVTQPPNTEIPLPLVQRLDLGCRMGL